MNPLAFLQEPLMIALGWALVHFLWQGAVIALLLALANATLQKAGPGTRYLLACGAMALMVISVIGTFIWFGAAVSMEPAPAAKEVVSVIGTGLAAAQTGPTHAVQLRTQVVIWLPWLDGIWLAGVFVLSARSVRGWVLMQRLKQWNTTPVDSLWEQRTKRLAQALKISRPVRISRSVLAQLPAVVGWLRPVILVPASAFTGVDAGQLEALLAHELAHIRRHDYLVNLVQTAVETLLFYHPAVWWVGRRIRIERENCCDDLAVSACGDVLTYARALTRLEELRAGSSRYAMAADGGVLLARIRRLIASGQPVEHSARAWLAGALAALTVCAVWAGAQVSSLRQSNTGGDPTNATMLVLNAVEPAPQAAPAPTRKAEPAPKPAAQAESKSFIGGLADAGYANLTVDQLIAFKIHGVTPEYIRQLRAAGMADLTPGQLVAFRIHEADPKRIAEFRAAGFGKLTPDQVVATQIHGVSPEYAKEVKGLGFGEVTVDQLIAMRIHSVTPEFGAEIKGLGLAGMTIDKLIAFRIHDVVVAQVREIQSLGLGTLTADQIVSLRIHDVTPEFVRSLAVAGLTKLSCDDVIAARIHGITATFIQEALKHGFQNLSLHQLIRLKQAGIL